MGSLSSLEAEGARTVCKEVGMAKLEAYVNASYFGAIDGVGRDWIRILRLRESPRLLGFELGLVGPDPRITGNRGIRTLESQVIAGSEP
jgi:hypothetical protein